MAEVVATFGIAQGAATATGNVLPLGNVYSNVFGITPSPLFPSARYYSVAGSVQTKDFGIAPTIVTNEQSGLWQRGVPIVSTTVSSDYQFWS